MPLTPTPNLAPDRRLIALAALVTVLVWAMLAATHGDIMRALGDTDDAMRLVRVRDLLAGQGWFDQRVMRLQPPMGSMMHWSRLLDAALAGTVWLFSRVMSAASAEWAMRFVWPLLWIAPAIACALVIARRLGGSTAVLIVAVLALIEVPLYAQFRPGRIDHHNIQIVMTLIAASSAMAGGGRPRWAALSGAASALGLAIGIEALAFHAVIGTSYALGLVIGPKTARSARAYGLTLSFVGAALFFLQTPPGLWSASACDALGANLVLALAVGGLGLAAVATWASERPVVYRATMICAVGAVAAGGYLALNPACLHGPLAAVDPRLRPIWLDRIQELRSWPALWRLDRPSAIMSMVMVAMGLAAAAILILRRRSDPAPWLAAAMVVLAAVGASQAYRLDDYVFWFGVPIVAVALGVLVDSLGRGALLSALAAGFLLSPQTVTAAVDKIVSVAAPMAKPARPVTTLDPCFGAAAYAPLAKLPAGLVLAPIDLGPFILAHTPSATLSAPYHRMAWGILAAYNALNTPPIAAETQVRALNIRYVVDCPSDHSTPRSGGLTDVLRHGQVPAWLKLSSSPNQPLRIYSVTPRNGPR